MTIGENECWSSQMIELPGRFRSNYIIHFGIMWSEMHVMCIAWWRTTPEGEPCYLDWNLTALIRPPSASFAHNSQSRSREAKDTVHTIVFTKKSKRWELRPLWSIELIQSLRTCLKTPRPQDPSQPSPDSKARAQPPFCFKSWSLVLYRDSIKTWSQVCMFVWTIHLRNKNMENLWNLHDSL